MGAHLCYRLLLRNAPSRGIPELHAKLNRMRAAALRVLAQWNHAKLNQHLALLQPLDHSDEGSDPLLAGLRFFVWQLRRSLSDDRMQDAKATP